MDTKQPCLHTENEQLRAGYDAARLEIESLQKAATDRHALQATGAHPAPCARYCEAQAFRIMLRNLHAENERLRASYDAALDEIASLQARVQELGQMARDVNSRRVTELEAQLAAVGAGGVEPLLPPSCWCESCDTAANRGWRSRMSLCPQCGDKRCTRAKNHTEPCSSVEPLRKRECLHQITEPAQAASIEQEAMQMLWNDQQQEEKEHYRNVARGAERIK